MTSSLLGAFLLGIVSSGHCLGMCGGLMMAAGLNSQKPSIVVGYNIGRLLTYVILGGLFGMFVSFLPETVLPFLKLLSASLLFLAALHLLNLSKLINRIEKVGLPLWSITQSVAKNLLPVRSITAATSLGFLWGFIPCGLVYTALSFSVSQTPVNPALIMLFFGLGTFPSMIGAAALSQQIRPWLSKPIVRKSLACGLIVFALYVGLSAFGLETL